MKVLLLGSTGMVGSAIERTLISRGIEVIGVARSNANLSCDLSDESQVTKILYFQKYDAVINAAALVNIDYCEKNSLDSWNINAKLISNLACFSNDMDIPLLHISTDHFYTYGENKPHNENDQIFCVNEYSRHKYAAEAFALTSKRSLVLRTSILGARRNGGKSLVEWAIENLLNEVPIELFCDAWTSSIDVDNFAKIALKVFLDLRSRGIINVAAREVYSKEQLIRKLADKLSINHTKCVSGSIKRSSVNRANCLGLDVTKVEKLLGEKMPTLNDVCAALIPLLTKYKSSLI